MKSTKHSMKALSALFVVTAFLALALPAFAATRNGPQGMDHGTVKGEVISVDNVRGLKAVTVASRSIGVYPNNEENILFSPATKVTICDMREPSKDIDAGLHATVRFHKLAGLLIADSIFEKC